MSDDPRLFQVFLDVQRGLPRQGPGCDDATRRALALCRPLPDAPRVLDVGCGPGAQSVALARALAGRITAVDLLREYLHALRERAEAAGVAARIGIVAADMRALPVGRERFDLVWSEGAAYIMGFERALRAWRELLVPGGCLALSELVWLRPDPPAELATFFGEEYPPMTDVATNLASLRACGYEPLDHFVLPDSAWWDAYYTPLETKLPGLRASYARDPEALSVVAASEREIAMRRAYPEWYGYAFFVARRPRS